ncbi:MAG: FMN-binding protein [Clostridia bacterium]|nr:FMN-binding protein [Clostridia bacterium]
MSFKKIIMPAVALLLICLVATSLLALTNQVTAARIETIAAQAENEARARVFPEARSFGEAKTVDSATYCEALDSTGKCIGYTFTTSAKGYGGDVSVMTGVRRNGTVRAVEILDVSNETPGLGQNAKQDGFKAQFYDKSGVIGVSTASKSAENGIDALTGATYTSRGVTDAVNLALKLFDQIPKGGSANG